MNLEKFRKFLGSTKGIVAYIALDKNGKTVTQNKGVLADSFNNVEFSTWALNFFHAIDTYYPESIYSILRFGAMKLYLRRDGQNLIAVVINHEANLGDFLVGFEKIASDSANTRTPALSTSLVEEKSKRGETVFLKISDKGGASATPVPVRKSVTATPVSSPRKANPLIPIVALILIVTGIVGLIVGLSGNKEKAVADKEADTIEVPPPTASAPSAVPTQNLRELALEARESAEALTTIANRKRSTHVTIGKTLPGTQLMMGRAAEAFETGDFESALNNWKTASDTLGEMLLEASRSDFEEALSENRLKSIRANSPALLGSAADQITMAEVLASNGEILEAIKAFDEAVAALPEVQKFVTDHLRDSARKASDSGEKNTALAFFEQLHEILPEDEEALNFLYRNFYKPGETIQSPSGIQLAYIPPGSFMMGSDPEKDRFADYDETLREVTLTRGFYMGTTEITQALWESVMARPITMERPDPAFINPRLPVHSITWKQAVEFCHRLSENEGHTYRLPTEAEWEYACRAGTSTPFNNGSNMITFSNANIFNPTAAKPAPLPVNTSNDTNAWGLHDMHGNVREWCLDWEAPYETLNAIDPKGPADSEIGDINVSNKITRGGSFIDDFNMARSANRLPTNPALANDYLGFRVVREVHFFER